MSILKSENHLHLYGCLTAEHLFHETFTRAKRYSARFQWFLSEYKKTTGISIHPDTWWSSSDGYDVFRRHFICDSVNRFDVFQAKFNLLIALFPPTPDDLSLARKVFETHVHEGGFKEYRTFLPLYLKPRDRALYLRNLIELARSFETEDYHPRLAISFSRQDVEAWDSYEFLCGFLADHTNVSSYITGIDFCGNEKGHPPSVKNKFFSHVQRDRTSGVHHLDVLYHVGEMWEDIALHSAARWCLEAAELGIRRLGHALALGMNPEALKGRTIMESKAEAEAHLLWLRKCHGELSEYGYTTKNYEWLAQKIDGASTANAVSWTYDQELIEHTRHFQTAALKVIKQKNPVIECCPTSNIRIGSLGRASFHPLKRFLEENLRVTISTDDPGIFDVTLKTEEDFVAREFGVSQEQLKKADDLAASLFLEKT